MERRLPHQIIKYIFKMILSRETWIKLAQLNSEWYRIMRTDEFMQLVGDNEYTKNIYMEMQYARRATSYAIYYDKVVPPCKSFTFRYGTVYFTQERIYANNYGLSDGNRWYQISPYNRQSLRKMRHVFNSACKSQVTKYKWGKWDYLNYWWRPLGYFTAAFYVYSLFHASHCKR